MMADITPSQAEAQRQLQLQATRDAAKMAERQRVAGLGVKPTIAVSETPVTGAPTPIQLADNVQLTNGELVNKETFYKLSEEDQNRLMQLGTRGFNNYYAKKEADFRANNIQLKDGSWVSKELYDSLSTDDKTLLSSIGIDKFNEQKTAEFEDFKTKNVQLKTGEWITNEQYNSLPQPWQYKIKDMGVEDFNKWLESAYGGKKEYIIIEKWHGTSTTRIFGKHPDPMYGYDEGGNVFYIGERWPGETSSIYTSGEPLSSRWPTEVKTFNPISLPEMKGVKAIYVGKSSALGGTWGMTPETLAVQKLGGNVIKYEGASELAAQKLTDKAISELSPKDKARYEAELKLIQSMPGTTIQEKLVAREELRTLEVSIAKQSIPYEALGVELLAGQTESGKSIPIVQLKTGEIMTREDFDKLSPEKQKIAAKEGYTGIYAKTAKGEYIDKDSLAQIPEKHRDILMKQGFAEYQKAFQSDFVYIEKSNEWLDKKTFEEMSEPQREYIQEHGSIALAKQQDVVLSSLEADYKQEDGYDIARYLRDNPKNSDILLLAGFEKEHVDEAVEWNEKPFVKQTKLEIYLDKVYKETGLRKDLVWNDRYTFEKLKSINSKLYAEGLVLLRDIETETKSKDLNKIKAPVSVNQFVADFMSVRGLEPLALTEVTKDKERSLASKLAQIQYAKTYGAINLGSSRLATAAEFFFTPAKALHPEISVKDVRAIDWAVGGAQVALLFAPVVSTPLRMIAPTVARGIATGLNIASGMVFTAATIKDWERMESHGKLLAVAVDTYLIASVLLELRGIHLPKKTKTAAANATSQAAQTIVKTTKQKNLYSILADIKKSIAVKDVKLLQSAGQRLELIGKKTPKELGGQELARRGKLLKEAPEEYVKLSDAPKTSEAIEEITKSIDDNLTFIDRAEDMLKKVKKPQRREILEEKVKLAKEQVAAKEKQLKLATKEKLTTVSEIKLEEALRRMEEIEKLRKEGKLAIVEKTKTSTELAKSKPRADVKSTTQAATKDSEVPERLKVEKRKTAETIKLKPREAKRAVPHIRIVWAIGTPLPSESGKLVVSPSVSPLVKPIPKPLTTTEVKVKTRKQTIVKTGTAVLPLELTETKLETKSKLAPAPVVQVKTKTQLKEKLAPYPLTKTQLKEKLAPYPVTTPEPVFPIKPVQPFEIKIPSPNGKGNIELTKKQIAGIIAWKQGFIYWMKYPDKNGKYPDKNTVHTREPIEGVKYEEGIGSVARSIIKKYGEIPQDIAFSMGIQNVEITKDPQPGVQKPKIEFSLSQKFRKSTKKKKNKEQKETAPSLRSAR